MPTVSLPDVSTDQAAILRAAFWFLLDAGEPVAPDQLATATGLDGPAVRGEIERLAEAGRLRLVASGAISGALGLSVEPTTHELRFGAARRHTWCALDALGIVAALDATGRLRTVSPHTGDPIEIGFVNGTATSGALHSVLFLARYQAGTPVVDAWCPLVNLFEDEAAARAWAANRGIEDGEFVPLASALPRAGDMWRPRIGAAIELARFGPAASADEFN